MRAAVYTYHIIFLLAWVYPAVSAGQARITLLPDHKKILIGEPIRLQVDITAPDSRTLQLEVPDQITHWTWLEGDTGLLKIEVGKGTFSKIWVITSYDTGYWLLPRMQLLDRNVRIRTDTIGIRVAYSAEDLTQDYRDIKEVIETPLPAARQTKAFFVWSAIIALIAVAIFLYWKKGKNNLQPSATASGIAKPDLASAWDNIYGAYQRKELDAVVYCGKAELLLREGIQQKYQLDTIHSTTAEIGHYLRKKALANTEYALLMGFLEEAELVKFALREPLEKDLRHYYDGLKVFFHFTTNR